MKSGATIWSYLLLCSFLISACSDQHKKSNITILDDSCEHFTCLQGAVVRGDTTQRKLSLVFTGGDFADGGNHIQNVLKSQNIKASFFFTGDFYRKSEFRSVIENLKGDGHYLGAHSNKHLLYCDWNQRDRLLVTKDEFVMDLKANYSEMEKFGITAAEAQFFLPPYEWYNDSISHWTKQAGFQLVNFTQGTRSNSDYTTPEMPSYRTSEEIFQSIIKYESASEKGLNGFILLIHIGTATERTDKFYNRLDELIDLLSKKGYEFRRIDELLTVQH